MLAHGAEDAARFTRSDAGRLIIAALLLIVAVGSILGSSLMPSPVQLEIGDLVPADIRAPRTLSFTSAIQTEQARKAARIAVEPQYDYSSERAIAIAAEQLDAFRRSISPLETAFDPQTDDETRRSLLELAIPQLSTDARATLLALSPDRWPAVRDEAARILDVTERAELRDTVVAFERTRLADRMAGGLDQPERALAAELIAPLVVPNSSFSSQLDALERDRRAALVTPVTERIVQGEIIIRGGTKLTEVDVEKIDAFGLADAVPDVASIGGWFLLAGLLVSLLLGWIWRFRRAFWHRNNVLLLLGLLLVFATVALKITAGRPALPFILPTAAIGILVAILLDTGAATVTMLVIGLIAGAVNGLSLEIAAYAFLGGFAGILAIRRGDRLQAFLQAGFAVLVTNGLVVMTFTLLGEHDTTGMIQLLGAAAIAAGATAVVAVGSFAVLGNLFGILTVFQLLELANPSQPLLRRLLLETPGTYHHSLMVGNLAERAATAIDADPLITRVAAYYHDIGKLANPRAFIENQAGGENIHDELEPAESAQMIKQHVADGIDIAYRARLPKVLISFIPQHHGTTVMSYFFARERETAAAPYGGLGTGEGRKAADAVDVRRFRHAGPKPQSREAALIMLADSVEASVRSLEARDEAAIRAMVSRIVTERMDDGQFEECDLTLRDVERVKAAFVDQLLGMYHQRVAYPQNKVVELEARRAAAGGAAPQASTLASRPASEDDSPSA
jgi:putative nucleotidyltransferase with HDIG domain